MLQWARLEEIQTSGDASQAPKLRVCAALTETPWRTQQWKRGQWELVWLNDPPEQCCSWQWQVESMPEDSKLAAEQFGLRIPNMVREEPGTEGSIHTAAEQWGCQQNQRLRKCQMHSLGCRCKHRTQSTSKEKQDSTGPEHRHSNQRHSHRHSKDCHRGRHKVSRIPEERHESWTRLAAGQLSDEVEIGR